MSVIEDANRPLRQRSTGLEITGQGLMISRPAAKMINHPFRRARPRNAAEICSSPRQTERLFFARVMFSLMPNFCPPLRHERQCYKRSITRQFSIAILIMPRISANQTMNSVVADLIRQFPIVFLTSFSSAAVRLHRETTASPAPTSSGQWLVFTIQ